MVLRLATGLGLVALAGASALAQETARSVGDELNIVRWREDYRFLRERPEPQTLVEHLKLLPLNDGKTSYLTLGGQARERVETYDPSFFGLPGSRNFTSFATRLLADADLHAGNRFRAFLELGSFLETGREPFPLPFDRGDLELQQGFFDLAVLDRPATRFTLRAGRQELPIGSLRLVSIREGTNVRLSFDAIKLTLGHGRTSVEAILGRPVDPKPEVFASAPSGHEAFWALDSTLRGRDPRAPNGEMFYLGRRLDRALYALGTARETRHTIGGRIWGRAAPWDYSVQVSGQFGSFGMGNIRAWGIATDTGYSFDHAPLRLRLALRADRASGDANSHDGTLGTFNAPYPALNYFSEATLFAPANVNDLHPYVEVRPARAVSGVLGLDLLWRLRREDAIYRAGGGILIPTGVSTGSFVTALLRVEGSWRPIPFIELRLSLVRASAERVVRDAGGRDATFFLVSTDFRFLGALAPSSR